MPDIINNQFSFDPTRGTFDVISQLQPILQNATAFITYRDVQGNTHHLAPFGNSVAHQVSDDRVTLVCKDGIVELKWNAIVAKEIIAWLEITNRSSEPIQMDALHVLSLDAANGAQVNLGASPTHWRFFQNGWQSWSAAFVRDCGNGIHADPANEEYNITHQPHAIPIMPKTMASE